MPAVQIVTYAAVLIGLAAIIVKIFRYATAPEHMRWELYPVPHEKGRADYGGSYLEELDWWNKPRHTDMFREMREMSAEIFLLKGVYHHNRRVWFSSLPFHSGLYLAIGWLVLLLAGALLNAFGIGVGPEAGIIGRIVHYLTIPVGYAAFILSGIGALGLFIWRLTDADQRSFNAPAEYVNLLLFVTLAAVVLVNHLGSDIAFVGLRAYTGSLITFTGATGLSGLMMIEILLVSLMLMYIPLSRMSHFVAKYFLYHSVRWNDQSNERGSKLEKRIIELLNKKMGWSASHIQTGASWAEVVKEPKK